MQGEENSPTIRSGVEMAKRFTERGNFNALLKAIMFFNNTNINDCWNSGVSSYIRVE